MIVRALRLRLLPLALGLSLCACDNPVDSAGQLKAGLTGLGSAVQNSAPAATNAAGNAASALVPRRNHPFGYRYRERCTYRRG